MERGQADTMEDSGGGQLAVVLCSMRINDTISWVAGSEYQSNYIRLQKNTVNLMRRLWLLLDALRKQLKEFIAAP